MGVHIYIYTRRLCGENKLIGLHIASRKSRKAKGPRDHEEVGGERKIRVKKGSREPSPHKSSELITNT